ncbi:12229_t:CDS:1, partial [Cetraspora pellucida]
IEQFSLIGKSNLTEQSNTIETCNAITEDILDALAILVKEL